MKITIHKHRTASQQAAWNILKALAIVALLIFWCLVASYAGQQVIASPRIVVSWAAYTQGADPAVNLIIWKSRVSGGPYGKLAVLDPTATSYNDTVVLWGQTYCYVTNAIDANGNMSAYSPQTCATAPNTVTTTFQPASSASPAAPSPPSSTPH